MNQRLPSQTGLWLTEGSVPTNKSMQSGVTALGLDLHGLLWVIDKQNQANYFPDTCVLWHTPGTGDAHVAKPDN